MYLKFKLFNLLNNKLILILNNNKLIDITIKKYKTKITFSKNNIW